MLLIATPDKITVVRDAPVRRASITTISTAAMAPPNAATDVAQPERTPNAQQTVTASPAPALMPMMPGDAS